MIDLDKHFAVKIGSIIFLFFLMSQLHAQKTKENDSASLSFTAQIINNIHDTLLVKTILTNNSSDTLTFLSMSCSWEDPYITDSQQFYIEGSNCDENGPVLISLASHTTEERILKLLPKNKTVSSSPTTFKIGFHLVKANKSNYVYIYSQMKAFWDMNNVIWSNILKKIIYHIYL